MGKIEKHTEYYCDICGDKILPYSSLPFSKNRFYKIKCYDKMLYAMKDYEKMPELTHRFMVGLWPCVRC